MKKMIFGMVALLCVVLCSGCGNAAPAPQSSSAADSTAQIANPRRDVETADDFAELGITVDAPADASEVSYTVIAGDVAEVNFKLQDVAYTLRASKVYEWKTLAGVYDAMTQTDTVIVATGSAQSAPVGNIYTVASGGVIGAWQWNDGVFTLYTQTDVPAEEFSVLCNTLAGATAAA